MTEQRVPITPEEQTRRNKLLRGKKRAMQLVLFLVMPIICAILYLLQKNEHLENQTLYIVTGVLTLLLLCAFLIYRRFARLIDLDMQSDEKIVAIGIVVRANFIGNNVYATRAYGNSGKKYVTLDVNGRWITLSGIQLKRLLPEVWQANRVYLREQFMVELTPYGRHIMHLERL
jgi:hypothetical protein